MAQRPTSTVGTHGLAREEAAPPGFPHALEGSSFDELRELTAAEWDVDTAWLAARRIDLGRDNNFNYVPPEWRCPGCGRLKYATISRTRDGQWSSGLQDHHVLGRDHDVLILICARCNLREACRRLAEGTIFNTANPWAEKYRVKRPVR